MSVMWTQDANSPRRHASTSGGQGAGFANAHRTLFLVLVFGFVIGTFAWNIYRLTVVYRHQPAGRTATEIQDSVLRQRYKVLQEGEIRENKNRGNEPQ